MVMVKGITNMVIVLMLEKKKWTGAQKQVISLVGVAWKNYR